MSKDIIKKHLIVLKEEAKTPGIDKTKKIRDESGKTNKAANKDVAKEMEDYDKPLKDDSKPVKNEYTSKEKEYHEQMEIMNGQEMAEYGNEPSEIFKKRAEEAIAGSKRMGNANVDDNGTPLGNVVTADQAGFTGEKFGENLVKTIKASKKKRDDAETVRGPKTTVSGADIKDSSMSNKGSKSIALPENKINKKNKMKRLVFKNEFKGIENALKVIPESYKVNGKEFHMTDGNEKYEIKWEGSLTEGRAVILKASDKNLMTEDMAKMKHLMGYSSKETLGTVKGSARLDENARFNDILGKTKNLMTEMTGGYGFSGEGNLEGMDEESNSSTSTSEISSQIKKEIPNLVNNPNIEKIANEILKDPKAIEDLKQFVSMGKTNEDEGVPVVDSSFIGDAISLGIEKASSLNEFKKDYAYRQNDSESSTEKNSEDIGGKIGGLVGAMVGGAYLADKLVPNPMVMGKIASNIGYVNQMMLENDPMVIAALGALAGAVISVVAYKVFKKKKNQTDEGMTGELNENKFSKKTKHTLLESIFDKVANIVKGKSDKEKAAIEAFKKFGLEIGKPFYSFTYLGTADSQEGEACAIEYFTKLTPEQREQHKVPMLNGFNGPIEKDGLKKIVIKSIEETEDGQMKTIFADGDYNFKTGNFEDVNSAVENIMDPDSIEKELGIEDLLLTQGLKMVPYNGSLWQEFMDKADKR